MVNWILQVTGLVILAVGLWLMWPALALAIVGAVVLGVGLAREGL